MTFLVRIDSPYDPGIFTAPIIAKDYDDLQRVFDKYLGCRGYSIIDVSVLEYDEW